MPVYGSDLLDGQCGTAVGTMAHRAAGAAMPGEHRHRAAAAGMPRCRASIDIGREGARIVTRIGGTGTGSRAHPCRLMLREHHVALASRSPAPPDRDRPRDARRSSPAESAGAPCGSDAPHADRRRAAR